MNSWIEILTYVLPGIISLIILSFLFFRRRSEIELKDIRKAYSSLHYMDIDEERNNNIEKLVIRGDVELRVLEEITKIESRSYFSFGRGKNIREIVLEKIQRDLRSVLRSVIDTENFIEIKDRIVLLLDQICNDLKEIRQKIPFEGLDDPERSLLIDLIEEIDPIKEIPRQKAHQLADIIKVKHQDIKKLQLENAKSAGWTRWGTVGTVSFGLLSLALSIYTIYT